MSITIHPDGSASCKCGWSCTEFKQTHNCVDYLQGRITELEESNMQAQWREDILKEKVADLQAEVNEWKGKTLHIMSADEKGRKVVELQAEVERLKARLSGFVPIESIEE